MFYKDTIKEAGHYTISASIVSSVIISLNIMSILFLLEYFDLLPQIKSKLFVIVLMFFIWFINYTFFVKDEKFLKLGFEKDIKGGVLVIISIILTGLICGVVANLNRDKDRKNKEKIEVENVRVLSQKLFEFKNNGV